MWAVLGRNGGIRSIHPSEWQAKEQLWRDDYYIQKVWVTVEEFKIV